MCIDINKKQQNILISESMITTQKQNPCDNGQKIQTVYLVEFTGFTKMLVLL